MKANEAPEKIYIDDFGSELSFDWHKQHCYEKDIEYVRKDAFIEKACEFMQSNIDPQLVIYHNNTWRKRDEFIKAFRKYMKGE